MYPPILKEEHFIATDDGVSLFTESAGEGPPVILCDGLGCDGFIWRHIWPVLVEQHQVIHWHYRGHGHSGAPPANSFSIDRLCADLTAVLDAYEVDRAVLLGHSMGVQVVLQYAIDNPDRVAALVPICGSYGRPLDTLHNTDLGSRALPRLLRVASRFPFAAQRVWSKAVSLDLAYRIATTFEVNGSVVSRDDFSPYFRHLEGMQLPLFLATLNAANEHTTEDALIDIAAPTLVVGGSKDTFTPLWLSQRIHALIEDSELMIVPGGSHIAPLEIPELLKLRMQVFLRDRVAPLFA